ncbi:DUF6600 domain-containing protein [Rhodanobacter humi]|uniref:DUF6600 domain-containing protein n=1 Tax=Rhodanobacter humi TaxID=1888173 RepID=A0ABV4APC0_9GAMM
MRVLASLLASWRHGWRPLAVLLLCAVAALAQAQSADDGDAAPPDRVARLSYIAGDLGFLPAGSQDWASADLNRPLTTGDRLSTGDGSRAELELGGGVLRMAGGTDFGLLNLNDNLAQVELTQGALNLSVRHLDQGQSYEIDTPTLALVVTSPGTFRVDVDNGGNGTRVTVFDGQATVYGENNAQHDVFRGRSYQFDDASLAALTVSDIGGGDAFDAWSSERDQRYAQSQTRRYVSDDVVGYQDLDQYGNWQSSPDYGAVWYPSQVPTDWAPYRDGHWAYVAPWGWTWVDDSPWGFAPYHYGRWAYIRGAWGWIPGPIVARPVYAPALVAFVGGGGWSVSVGIGGGAPVGWFPLGPGEVYNPWYHCDRDYYRRVNVTNIYVHNTVYRTTVINNINNQYNYYREGRAPQNQRYANRAAPRGFTAVSGTAFAGGRRVQRDLLRVDPRQLAAAPVLARGVTALRPSVRSVAPARGPQARPLPTADFRRNVVARTPPPAALPAVHSNFTPATARTPQRAATPFANVRVLNGRGAPPRPPRRRPRRPAPSRRHRARCAPRMPPPTCRTCAVRNRPRRRPAPCPRRASPIRAATSAACPRSNRSAARRRPNRARRRGRARATSPVRNRYAGNRTIATSARPTRCRNHSTSSVRHSPHSPPHRSSALPRRPTCGRANSLTSRSAPNRRAKPHRRVTSGRTTRHSRRTSRRANTPDRPTSHSRATNNRNRATRRPAPPHSRSSTPNRRAKPHRRRARMSSSTEACHRRWRRDPAPAATMGACRSRSTASRAIALPPPPSPSCWKPPATAVGAWPWS